MNDEEIVAFIKSLPWAKWVNYIAMDYNYDWYAYEGIPTQSNDWTWENPGYSYEHDDEEITIIKLPYFSDWRKSLIRVKDKINEKLDASQAGFTDGPIYQDD